MTINDILRLLEQAQPLPSVFAEMRDGRLRVFSPGEDTDNQRRPDQLFKSGRAAGKAYPARSLARYWFAREKHPGLLVIGEFGEGEELYYVYHSQCSPVGTTLSECRHPQIVEAGLVGGLAWLCGWRSRLLPNAEVERRRGLGLHAFLCEDPDAQLRDEDLA